LVEILNISILGGEVVIAGNNGSSVVTELSHSGMHHTMNKLSRGVLQPEIRDS
jgi:hypothetical protein